MGYTARRRWLGTLIKRSFSLAGRRTSVALEQEFWRALEHIAASRQQMLAALVVEADAQRPEGWPLASTLRVLACGSSSRPTIRTLAWVQLIDADDHGDRRNDHASHLLADAFTSGSRKTGRTELSAARSVGNRWIFVLLPMVNTIQTARLGGA